MARFRLTDLEEAVEFKTSDGGTIKLMIRPLSRVEKIAVVAARTIRMDMAEAERLILGSCVRDWSGVEDERGRPAKFSFSALDRVLGHDSDLAIAVSNHLWQGNGLLESEPQEGNQDKGSPVPLESEPAASSASTSIAGG